MLLDELAVVFLFLILSNCSERVTVTVKQGTLLGTRGTTVFDGRIYYAFYGVPYAQPPLKKLRFKDPKPPKKWKTFDASTEYHGACAQAHIIHKHNLYGFENCLRMNIYTPNLPKDDQSDLKPIVMWIHGYAFTSSFSHIHGGDFFIDNDVLFVSVSHRIGAFGFLKIDDTTTDANMGLKDIVMALKWIRKNIKTFGGDKHKITVMGSGSGATFLALLLTTKSHKLFSKMILQSGGLYSPSIFQGDSDLERIKLKHNLKLLGEHDISNAKTANITSASQKIYTSKEIINYQRPVVPFTPSIEMKSNKSLLTEVTENFYKEIRFLKTNKPIMIGFSSQESISEMLLFIHKPQLLTYFETYYKYMIPFWNGCKFNYTSQAYKLIAERIKQSYFNGKISEKSVDNFLKFSTDLHKYPIYKFTKNLLAAKHGQLFMYKFNYNGKLNAVKANALGGIKRKIKGASNGDEICYLLKCEPLWEYYHKINTQVNNPDRIFIKRLSELWSNFAKTGNPTPSNFKCNLTWPPATATEDNMLLIGRQMTLIRNPTSEHKMYEFWNEIYRDYYSSEHCPKQKHLHTEL